MKADEDLVIVPGVRADRSEPLERGGVIAKLGVDATLKDGGAATGRMRSTPRSVITRARELLSREFGDARAAASRAGP